MKREKKNKMKVHTPAGLKKKQKKNIFMQNK